MSKKVVGAIFLLCVLLSAAAHSASPIGAPIWARPIALGNAYAAYSGNTDSIFINPAGPVGLPTRSFISAYNKPSDDLTFTSVGGVLPKVFGGAVSLGYRNQIVNNVPISPSEEANFLDHDLLVGFAKQVRGNLTLGLDCRYLIKQVTTTSPIATNGSGFAFDLGAQYRYSPWLTLGAAVQDLGLKLKYANGTEDEFNPNIVVGASAKMQNLAINLDLGKEKGNPLLAHLGLEWWPVDIFAFRLGLDQSPKSQSEAYSNTTFGLGFKTANLTLDYALYHNESSFLSNTHYFSLGYSEPLPVPKPEVKPIELKHFSDVPPDHWARGPIEYLTTDHLMNWYSDGTFRPEQPVSRAETITLLVRAKDYPTPAEKRQVFSDVPLSYAAAEDIQTAFENQLAYGYPDRTFKPRRNTDRAEGTTFLARFDNLKLTGGRLTYSDVPAGHWAIREVLSAREAGLLTLLAKGDRFYPDLTLTRAELADLLYRTSFVQERVRRLTPP